MAGKRIPKMSEEENGDALIDTVYGSLSAADGFEAIVSGVAPVWTQLDSKHSSPNDLYGRIRHHLENAIGLIANLAPPLPEDPISRAISDASGPAIAISDKLTVISCNEAAAKAFQVRSGSRTDLDWLEPQSREELSRLLKGKSQHTAILYLTVDGPASRRLAQAKQIAFDVSNARVVLVSTLTAEWSLAAEEVMESAFGLTPAEVDIAASFFRDPNTERIAASRSVSTGTIRKQLKSIYMKTGTTGQTELQQLLGLIVQSKTKRAGGGLNVWCDPLGHEEIIPDPDGRKVAFTWMGAEDGEPMLLCHGSMTGYLFTAETREAIAEAGIKIYVVCRPGYGSSDPYTEVDAVTGACSYLKAVLDHLDLPPLPGIGLVSGIVPLIAFAAKEPGRINRLLSFGGGIPLDNLEDYNDFPRNVRVLLGLNRRAPKLARLAIRAGYRQVLRQGPEYMVRSIYGVADADRKMVNDCDMLALLTASSRMLAVHGTETFERELDLQSYGWLPDLIAADIPMHAVTGGDDPLFTVDRCRELADRVSGYSVEEIEGCGQLVFLQAPAEVERVLRELK